MTIQSRSSKILSVILGAALCLTPEMVSAAPQQQGAQPAAPQSQPDAAQTTPANTQPSNNQQSNQQNQGTTVDPTQAPLQPVTTYPEAPTPQEEQTQPAAQPSPSPTTSTTTTTTTAPAPKDQKPVSEPVGAAAAEKVPTAGGAASKPAGAAIAPAKQHQTRSLLIKIGAIAAGGIAAGTIYALSKGTSSKPPNATGTGVTQK